jgi:hypothetical protein
MPRCRGSAGQGLRGIDRGLEYRFFGGKIIIGKQHLVVGKKFTRQWLNVLSNKMIVSKKPSADSDIILSFTGPDYKSLAVSTLLILVPSGIFPTEITYYYYYSQRRQAVALAFLQNID